MPWEYTIGKMDDQRRAISAFNLPKDLEWGSGWSHTADGTFSADDLAHKDPGVSGPFRSLDGKP
jgi:hypothetical protein